MRSHALIVVAAVGLALAGCRDDGDRDRPDTGALTRQQYDAAVNTALHEVENQDATISSATAILKHNAGRNTPSNTGMQCTSDQVLRIRLIGSFPHTDTAGGFGGDVTEMDIKADAVSGDACLISVSTTRHPEPEQGATVLQLSEAG
jgi:hypothetical protein